MANNTIRIAFEGCEPLPSEGFKIFYRPVGNLGEYREAPENYIDSPAEWVDTMDPAGTIYEGYMQGDCGGGKLGPAVTFVTTLIDGGSGSDGSESEGEIGYSISYTNNEDIPIELKISQGGPGATTDIYNGGYPTDPVEGSSPELPAVNAMIVLVVGAGKTFLSASCNGVPHPFPAGSSISWLGVNGSVNVTFVTT